jgi:hypothetical protein
VFIQGKYLRTIMKDFNFYIIISVCIYVFSGFIYLYIQCITFNCFIRLFAFNNETCYVASAGHQFLNM